MSAERAADESRARATMEKNQQEIKAMEEKYKADKAAEEAEKAKTKLPPGTGGEEWASKMPAHHFKGHVQAVA